MPLVWPLSPRSPSAPGCSVVSHSPAPGLDPQPVSACHTWSAPGEAEALGWGQQRKPSCARDSSHRGVQLPVPWGVRASWESRADLPSPGPSLLCLHRRPATAKFALVPSDVPSLQQSPGPSVWAAGLTSTAHSCLLGGQPSLPSTNRDVHVGGCLAFSGSCWCQGVLAKAALCQGSLQSPASSRACSGAPALPCLEWT